MGFAVSFSGLRGRPRSLSGVVESAFLGLAQVLGVASGRTNQTHFTGWETKASSVSGSESPTWDLRCASDSLGLSFPICNMEFGPEFEHD